MIIRYNLKNNACIVCICLFCSIVLAGITYGQDLKYIKESGMLRHLGVPYANFITGRGDGLDVELMERFAEYLGVNYKFIETTWENAIVDLIGNRFTVEEGQVRLLASQPAKGDILASGLTVLPWREQIVDYSVPTFPTQVWFLVPADSPVQPIRPSGKIEKDIALVKRSMAGLTVLVKGGTCLDGTLYHLAEAGAEVVEFPGLLNEMIPAVIFHKHAQSLILDVPDVLVALRKWPEQIKVIGPVSREQEMAVAFRKSDKELRKNFNLFFQRFNESGAYGELLRKYYPGLTYCFPRFFK